MPGKVFISYRRDDAKYPAHRIYTAVCAALSVDDVFMDIHSVPPGVDFVELLESWVDQSDVLLALIGSSWIDVADPKTGLRRLDNINDFVRVEIRRALRRNIPVVPVLLDGTPMPDPYDLPADLQAIVRRQAEFIEFRTFDDDVERLMRKLGWAASPDDQDQGVAKDEERAGEPPKLVYVSYPTEMAPALLKRVVSALIGSGLRIWMHNPLSYGFSDEELRQITWQQSLLDNQATQPAQIADATLFLISRSSLKNMFQQQELSIALKRRRLVPCIVDERLKARELPAQLYRFNVRKLTGKKANDDAALNTLVRDVAIAAGTIPKIKRRAWQIHLYGPLIGIAASLFPVAAAN